MRYILIIAALFCSLPQISAQNNITYGAGISYTNGAPSFVPPARTSRVAIDTITGKWYHFNTPGGWQLIGNTIEEIAGCSTPAYTPNKGDSKVVINNCTTPELYFYNGSAWIWINQGANYYAGDGIRIQNDSIILDSLYTLRFRTGSAADGEAGRLSWDANEGTIDVVLNAGGVTGQMFEDVFFNCRNQTGSTITRGTVVMAVGTHGASGRILIAPAIANGTVNSEYILGTAAQDISNGSDGLVYHFGKDRGLNTTGASCGETWADRDVLYCSATTPGCLTKALPTAPNLKVPIAFVIRAGNNGTLFIRPSHFPGLNQINDVQLTSPTTGQTLIYNSVTGVWSNQTPADPSATNELQTLSTGTNTLTLSNGGGTVTVDTDPASDVTGSGTTGQVSFWTGTQTQGGDNGLFWDNTNKRLGLGVTTPTLPFQIERNANSSQNIWVRNINTGNNAYSGIAAASIGISPSTTGSIELRAYSFGHTIWPSRGLIAASSELTNGMVFITSSASPIEFWTNNGRRAIIASTGEFSIGTTSAAARLHVVGSGTSSSTWTAQFHNSAGNNNALMIRDDGNVGIGTNTPTARLHAVGAGATSATEAFRAANSDNKNLFRVLNNGWLRFGNAANSASPIFFPFTNQQGASDINGTNLCFFNYTTSQSSSLGKYFFTGEQSTQTSGNNFCFYINEEFTPPSGNATSTAFYVRSVINQTAGGTGITRGLSLVPSLINAVQYQTVHWDTPRGANNWGLYGQGTALNYLQSALAIGTTTQDASSAFEVASTTQGVLFPRMTTTQRNAIATPADGLVIYNTTDNKLQVRAAGVWVDLH